MNLFVAIKQMDLDKQPKKELAVHEILLLKAARHPNVVNYINSFLYKKVVWVVMEYMEGGSLTDVATVNLMSEGQIAAVSKEICQGLEHLHRHGVIHRDIKSSNVLLSLNGDIKLSTSHLFPTSAHHAWFYYRAPRIVDFRFFSRLWILCTNIRGQRQTYDHDWNPLLDGSRGRNEEGVRIQGRHLVFGNCGNR